MAEVSVLESEFFHIFVDEDQKLMRMKRTNKPIRLSRVLARATPSAPTS